VVFVLLPIVAIDWKGVVVYIHKKMS
jgi:hypothetical protein